MEIQFDNFDAPWPRNAFLDHENDKCSIYHTPTINELTRIARFCWI